MPLKQGQNQYSPWQISYAGFSDTGRVRRCNEDSMLLCAESGVFAVADGLGGLDAGDLASRIALARLEEIICEDKKDQESTSERPIASSNNRRVVPSVEELIHMVNLHTYEQKIRLGRNMATTLAMLRFRNNAIIAAHVGDSRIYLWRDGRLRLLTRDHSLINELKEKGALTAGQEHSSQRHIITRALGAERSVQPSITHHPMKTQDLLLLCTDGLTSMLSDSQIAQILQSGTADLSSAAQHLVLAANEAGGHDNITVVLVFIGAMSQ